MSDTATDVRIDIPALLPSWQRSLRAARRSPRTVQSYTEAAEQLSDFLVRKGMPTAVTSIRREHVEAFIEDLDSRFIDPRHQPPRHQTPGMREDADVKGRRLLVEGRVMLRYVGRPTLGGEGRGDSAARYASNDREPSARGAAYEANLTTRGPVTVTHVAKVGHQGLLGVALERVFGKPGEGLDGHARLSHRPPAASRPAPLAASGPPRSRGEAIVPMTQTGRRRCVERSNASGGSDIGERLATAANTSSAGPPPPPADSAADTPTRHGRRIVFGLLGLCALLVIALGALLFTDRQPPVKASSLPQASPRPEDSASPPLGFNDSLLDIGWQDYWERGFSIALPPGWIPYIKDIPNPDPYLEWVGMGYSDTRHPPAWLYVFKAPVEWPPEVAETMFERRRLQILGDPTVVRATEMTEIQLSDGVGYTYTTVSETPSGLTSETAYEILHDGYVYALAIDVRLKHRDEFGSLFDDIARAFEITD